ncbi:MAG: hypothetical protein AAB482_04175 [Patescibacteria group bacterium]
MRRIIVCLFVFAVFVGFTVNTTRAACPPQGCHCSAGGGGPCPNIKTSPEKCRATIDVAVAKYAAKEFSALYKCEKGRVCGVVGKCIDCTSDEKYKAAIAKGKAWLLSKVVRFCAPYRASEIGVSGQCAGFAGGCNFALVTSADYVSCQACLADSTIHFNMLSLDRFNKTGGGDRKMSACRIAIASGAGIFTTKVKVAAGCRKRTLLRKKECSTSEATKAVEKQKAAFVKAVGEKCLGFSLDKIGLSGTCLVPGGVMEVQDTDDVVRCAMSSIDFTYGCFSSNEYEETCAEAQYPPSVCVAATPTPVSTPVPTVTVIPTVTQTQTPCPTTTPTATATKTTTPIVTCTPTATCTPRPTATVTSPAFPYCENLVPPGNHASNHGGFHQIVGELGQRLGDDDVYSIPNGNFVQCYCNPQTGGGIQTNWWRTSLSNFMGWPFREWGGGADDWNLGDYWYLAQNRNYQCGMVTPTPTTTPTCTKTKTPTPTVTATPVCDCATLAASLTIDPVRNFLYQDGTPLTDVTVHGNWNQCGPAVATLHFGFDNNRLFFDGGSGRDIVRSGAFTRTFSRVWESQNVRVELDVQSSTELCSNVQHVTVPAR